MKGHISFCKSNVWPTSKECNIIYIWGRIKWYRWSWPAGLKNKDRTEQLKLSSVWFVKLFQVHDKLEAMDMTKTDIFVPHQTITQIFVPRTDCLKYQNNISFPKDRIKQKIIQRHENLSCAVLPYIVLFFLILFLYSTCSFANQTHPSCYNK